MCYMCKIAEVEVGSYSLNVVSRSTMNTNGGPEN